MEEGVRGCGTFVLFLTSPNESDWSKVSDLEADKDKIYRSVTMVQARFRGNQVRAVDRQYITHLPVVFNELQAPSRGPGQQPNWL